MLTCVGHPVPDTAHVRPALSQTPFICCRVRVFLSSAVYPHCSLCISRKSSSPGYFVSRLTTDLGSQRLAPDVEVDNRLRRRRRMGPLEDANRLPSLLYPPRHPRA